MLFFSSPLFFVDAMLAVKCNKEFLKLLFRYPKQQMTSFAIIYYVNVYLISKYIREAGHNEI